MPQATYEPRHEAQARFHFVGMHRVLSAGDAHVTGRVSPQIIGRGGDRVSPNTECRGETSPGRGAASGSALSIPVVHLCRSSFGRHDRLRLVSEAVSQALKRALPTCLRTLSAT